MIGARLLCDLARGLMPPGFGVAVLPVTGPAPLLLAPEAATIARAVPKRRLEFALGRRALRLAIAAAGHDLPADRPIASRPDRRPDLPEAICASLSHTGSYCIAVAAPPGGPYVGVDIEADQPAEGLAGTVAPYRMTDDRPLLAFCVKEAIFKAQYPHCERMLEFSDVAVVIRGGRARACLGDRLIAARWGQAAGHYLAVSLWRG